MTREEAIDVLKHNYPSDCYTDLCEAVETAIQALSAQPERLTDDDFETIRIHLNAQKEKFCNQHRWEEAEEYQRIINRFMAFASAQPEVTEEAVKEYCRKRCLYIVDSALLKKYASAQPEQKKGKWEEHHVSVYENIGLYVVRAKCSVCERYSWYTTVNDKKFNYNFCPRCGADMRGE